VESGRYRVEDAGQGPAKGAPGTRPRRLSRRNCKKHLAHVKYIGKGPHKACETHTKLKCSHVPIVHSVHHAIYSSTT
jgi:hypothetical protein